MTAFPRPKPGIMDITPYVAGKSATGAAAQEILKLSSNENSLGPSPKAITAFTSHAPSLLRYPDSSCLPLRKAIGAVHHLPHERLICGNGSDELIGLLVHAYAGPGDELLYSQYGFLMYKIYAQGCGATPVAAPESCLTADVGAILSAVTQRTRIVFLANPNNPTGSYLPASELKRLRDGLPPQVVLVLDSAYAEYAGRQDYSSGEFLVEAGENTVMLRTFSKIYGLSSLRLGWGYFPDTIADAINRLRGPFNVSGAAIATGIAAVEDVGYTAQMKAHNSHWLAWTANALAQLGLTVHPSVANFLLVQFPPAGKTSAEANLFLLGRGIIVREVISYGLPECLRITIGNERENRKVVAALADFMKN